MLWGSVWGPQKPACPRVQLQTTTPTAGAFQLNIRPSEGIPCWCHVGKCSLTLMVLPVTADTALWFLCAAQLSPARSCCIRLASTQVHTALRAPLQACRPQLSLRFLCSVLAVPTMRSNTDLLLFLPLSPQWSASPWPAQAEWEWGPALNSCWPGAQFPVARDEEGILQNYWQVCRQGLVAALLTSNIFQKQHLL